MGIRDADKMDWHKCAALNDKKDCKSPAHKLHKHHWLGGWYWSNGKVNKWTPPVKPQDKRKWRGK